MPLCKCWVKESVLKVSEVVVGLSTFVCECSVQDKAMPQPDKQLSVPLSSSQSKGSCGRTACVSELGDGGLQQGAKGNRKRGCTVSQQGSIWQVGLPHNSHHSSVGAEQNGSVCVLLCSPKGEE